MTLKPARVGLALAAATLVAGSLVACGGSSKENGGVAQNHAAPAGGMTAAKPSADQAMSASTAGAIELVGTTGCGHCNFHKTESCAVGLETADGHFYVVDGVGQDTEVWNQRFSGKKMKVKGTVAAKDGLDHVQMASYEWVE
ncbi:MAG: hypothetical protein U0527_05815 [Candidatus Eisenbacteria bacterium]